MTVLGASFDTVAENKAFAEKFGFPYRLLCDTSREIGLKYGAADAPTSSHAKRVAYLIGPDGAIKRVWPSVDVKAFADEVAAAL